MRWDFDGFHTQRFNDLKDCKVSWTFDGNHFAWTRDGPHCQIQRLHAAARNRQIIRRKAASICNRAPGDLASKCFEAIGELVTPAVCGIGACDLADDLIQLGIRI